MAGPVIGARRARPGPLRQCMQKPGQVMTGLDAGLTELNPDMAGERRGRPSWHDVERGVKLALRIAAEVVRLIIELHGRR
jgi:hypothetical protein